MNLKNEFNTVPKLLRNVVKNIHPETKTFLLHKQGNEWKEISYKETLDNADAISSYLLDMGIRKGDRLGFIIENSPQYIFYDQGLQQIGGVNVSVYPTLAEHEIEYILNDAEVRTILVGTPFLLRKILKIANNCPSLERIIPAFEGYEKHLDNQPLNAGIIGFSALLEEGRKSLPSHRNEINACREAVLSSDLSALIYTSGTTGIPKGVMLTHANFTDNVWASLEQITIVNTEELFLSFLPLSHVFERTATYHICCAKGCKIAFSQSLELLAKNMEEIKPTVMSCVPRLLERIHDKAVKSATQAGGAKARVFNWAVATGKKYREIKEAGKNPGLFLSLQRKLADKLVFSKVKEKTGGRLKFLLSGGAALPQNVGEFFGNLGIKVLEGFGLTETSPVMAVTEYDRQVYGTVGRIIPRIEVGIQDPDTRKIYTIQTHDTFHPEFESPEGEIIVRGHCVMKGYWNKPEETAMVIDQEGWFHTGDIGLFHKGNLKITDRIKNILVNSYGKNIYPTPVENTYLKSQKIEQIFLIGDKREYITAIIVPSKDSLQHQFGLTEEFFQRPDMFIEDEEIVNWIAQDVRTLSNELAKFERIKNFKIKRNPFSIEAGEITPSLKAKRKVIEKKYAEDINKLYQEEVAGD
ncbi:AMP-dependent synthetase/ligase [Pararcticibacter amylolyticus]|uniref:Long-chain fatty acid--CoA ligase n=1 Tax=Pararcticibacter amylolyticus TaxID=2173175 RepID=A0A2U2PD98_9SPHI|nr:long-chain fatty acid--CoA ligase [Pararcticibacter amylolyticus]PWG79343.1 long-chain fatty acid--CoA ligase [Pararcticibacter amylolyticus]